MSSLVEIVARPNAHGQILSIDGEEMGGGPYWLTLNRAQSSVVVSRIPVWADGWPEVFRALRAVVEAWEMSNATEAPLVPDHGYAKRLWAAAAVIARAGKIPTCAGILARVHPAPRAPRQAPRWPAGRVLSHDPSTGEAIVVYGGWGPQGLVGGTVVVGGRR